MLMLVSPLVGCAGRNAVPVAATQPTDFSLACHQIDAEVQNNEARIRQLHDEKNSAHNSNIAVAAVGALLFWPALFALDTSDAEQVEIQALRDRNNHLFLARIIHQGRLGSGQPVETARFPTNRLRLPEIIRRRLKNGISPWRWGHAEHA